MSIKNVILKAEILSLMGRNLSNGIQQRHTTRDLESWEDGDILVGRLASLLDIDVPA